MQQSKIFIFNCIFLVLFNHITILLNIDIYNQFSTMSIKIRYRQYSKGIFSLILLNILKFIGKKV